MKRIPLKAVMQAALKASKPRGRPTLYKPEFVKVAKKMCELGATDAELATAFGVKTQRIWMWRVRYTDFNKACVDGKDFADNRVEASLYHAAIGFSHDAVDIRVVDGKVKKIHYRKQYPPDTTAAFKWLHNRRPNKWRDKVHLDVTSLETKEFKSAGELRKELERRNLPPVLDVQYECIEDMRERK